jgi:hypothetical protein
VRTRALLGSGRARSRDAAANLKLALSTVTDNHRLIDEPTVFGASFSVAEEAHAFRLGH